MELRIKKKRVPKSHENRNARKFQGKCQTYVDPLVMWLAYTVSSCMNKIYVDPSPAFRMGKGVDFSLQFVIGGHFFASFFFFGGGGWYRKKIRPNYSTKSRIARHNIMKFLIKMTFFIWTFDNGNHCINHSNKFMKSSRTVQFYYFLSSIPSPWQFFFNIF